MEEYEGGSESVERGTESEISGIDDNLDSSTELMDSEDGKAETFDENSELMDSDKNQEIDLMEKDGSESIENVKQDDNGETGEVSESLSEDRAEINEKSEYSKETTAYIKSVEELEIYQNAGLKETEIDGRTCLIRDNIDMEQETDEFGTTNAELMEEGYAPFDKEGNKIELHHIGQKDDSPLAELNFDEHRSSRTYSILHDTSKESEIDRKEFADEREAHWKSRFEMYKKGA